MTECEFPPFIPFLLVPDKKAKYSLQALGSDVHLQFLATCARCSLTSLKFIFFFFWITGSFHGPISPSLTRSKTNKLDTRASAIDGECRQGRSNGLKGGGTPKFRLAPSALAWASPGNFSRRGTTASQNI